MTKLVKGGDADVATFKYEQLDGSTANFLRKKETNMREIVGKAYTELGRELTEARDRLASHNRYEGVFRQWCDSIGMKKDAVNRLIQRYDLVAICDNIAQDLLEDLPVSLTYAIASPSAESTPAKAQAKAEVLAGEIDTRKVYLERIAELEELTKQAEAQAELSQRSEELLQKRLEEVENGVPDFEIRTEYVEVPDEQAKVKIKRYEELFGDVSMYDGQTTRVTNGDAITYTVFEYTEATRKFVEKFGHLTHFAAEFGEMIDEGKQEYRTAINDMRRFLATLERSMDEAKTTIING